MSIANKIVDHLRNQEVTEQELIKIYTDFGRGEYSRGFNEGCEYIRGAIHKQRLCRRQNLRDKYNKFLTKIDDYIHAI